MIAEALLEAQPEIAATRPDPFPINGTDYVEIYCGNAKQASHYYRSAFGFRLEGSRVLRKTRRCACPSP